MKYMARRDLHVCTQCGHIWTAGYLKVRQGNYPLHNHGISDFTWCCRYVFRDTSRGVVGIQWVFRGITRVLGVCRGMVKENRVQRESLMRFVYMSNKQTPDKYQASRLAL
jgi:hypothetical protein